MRKSLYVIGLLLIVLSSCRKPGQNVPEIVIPTICNQKKVEPLKLKELFGNKFKVKSYSEFKFSFKEVSGSEVVESIIITPKGELEIKTNKLGIARYQLKITSKKNSDFKPKIINVCIASQYLMDFTQNRPFEPAGSINGISYPENSLVQVSAEVVGVDTTGVVTRLSPGLLVNRKVAPFPHNKLDDFLDFESQIKYYGYKENENEFRFRYEPLIPMLEVGNGVDNRGVGIIVINKNQIINDSNIKYELEGYCSIRTRTDAPETYNLGVVVGTINRDRATYKDAIVARNYFNIGYSCSGQIFSNKFSLENDDYLTLNIVGEAGDGGDRKRTTRFEYIKISPSIKK